MFLCIVFFLIIEHDNCEKTVFKSPEGILTATGQVRRSFLPNWRSGQKKLSQKEGYGPCDEELLRPFLLQVPTMVDIE